MRDRLRGWVEGIVLSVLGSVIVAVSLGALISAWAAFISLAVPLIVATFVAVTGGSLGLISFTSRHLVPKRLSLIYGGIEWVEVREGEARNHFSGIIPRCPHHHVQLFGRNQDDVMLRELVPNSRMTAVHCVDAGGHDLDIDAGNLWSIFTGARALMDRERLKRRVGPNAVD